MTILTCRSNICYSAPNTAIVMVAIYNMPLSKSSRFLLKNSILILHTEAQLAFATHLESLPATSEKCITVYQTLNLSSFSRKVQSPSLFLLLVGKTMVLEYLNVLQAIKSIMLFFLLVILLINGL